jgi:hypothetical protein
MTDVDIVVLVGGIGSGLVGIARWRKTTWAVDR